MAVVCKRTDFAIKVGNIPRFLGENDSNEIYHKVPAINFNDMMSSWILMPAVGGKDREEYYAKKDARTSEVGHDRVFQEYMEEEVFIEKNITDEYSEFVDETVYKPSTFPSCVNKIEINEEIGLIANIDGITQDSKTVCMKDEYWKKIKDRTLPPYIIKDIKIKMLGTMAVWKAKKCIYILSKMDNQTITLDFDSDKWENILSKLKEIDYYQN